MQRKINQHISVENLSLIDNFKIQTSEKFQYNAKYLEDLLRINTIHKTETRTDIIKVIKNTTTGACRLYETGIKSHTCEVYALNFANRFHIGGGYKQGAQAQEEDLCRIIPNLYTTLITHKHLYPLDYIQTIYSPQMTIARKEKNEDYRLHKQYKWFNVNIITCGAPDMNNEHFSSFSQYKFVLYSQILNIIMTPYIKNCKEWDIIDKHILILGAFGCGAFRNDPEIVSRIFKYIFTRFPRILELYDEIIFPIPDDKNLTIFKKNLISN